MYTIQELRTNEELPITHPSWNTFDVHVIHDKFGTSKWVSICYELFFEHLKFSNPELSSYIENNLQDTWEDQIVDLFSLGYNFHDYVVKYIYAHYNDFTFKVMPNYDPDFSILEFEF